MPDYADANPAYTAIPNTIVYNNFPCPAVSEKQREAIKTVAQGILDARAKFSDSTLADLYDPITMPPELGVAPNKLDKAVRRAWQKIARIGGAERIAFLFERYQQLVNRLQSEKNAKNVKDTE